ncbi:MAG: type II toxin-antitoxin system VapC family toxin [Chloroflexi bacterium]|nr:type II toxin-antitoxin system VapC family toxin [Chloroflexota bacterium]
MIRVLDSHALMTYLQKQSGWETVRTIFAEAIEQHVDLLMSAVNFGEVYYLALRRRGAAGATIVASVFKTLPITVMPVDQELAIEAACFKAAGSIAYADCFAAALAKKNQAELVTGDPEFKALDSKINILWI